MTTSYRRYGDPAAQATEPVQPPSPTSEAVAAGGTPAAKTFGAFTDPSSLIDSYSAVMTNAVGSSGISGSGLGAYTFSGTANGNSFTLSLKALDADGDTLATATHTVNIAADTVDLNALVLNDINLTDGSWTLYDPSSLIKSVTWDAGTKKNTITFNALASGNAAYNWKNSSTKSGPRWYRTAAIDGNNLSRGNTFTGIYVLDSDDSVRDFKGDFIVGIARDASSTAVSNVMLGGAICSLFSASVPSNAAYGVYSYSAATSAGTSGPDNGLITYLHGGEKVGGGASYPLASDGTANNVSTRSSNQNISTGGSPLHQVVAVGTYNNTATIAQDDTMVFAAKYALIKPVI
jgi:hypothetical protein|tara:strand:- start:7451 stop:8494 length:1044 start_codon:yes stop_codon:yes gene_type:complete